jgi:hypothetical protein
MRELAVIGILGLLSTLSSSRAYGQTPAPQPGPGTPVIVQMPDGTYQQGYAVPVAQQPKPEPKQFAITTNPFNLYIGRYGINLEYQPVLHHGMIVSPHYDHVNADVTGTDINGTSATYKDSFSGYGAELGYRFYSGEKGFNGFFASPSLLVASYNASGAPLLGVTSGNVSFTSVGWAWEVGGQGQIGNFVIGGGGGLQYTHVSKEIQDLPFAAAVIAGGGWRPRLIMSLGGAF